MTESCPPPSGGDLVAGAVNWNDVVEELRRQWQLLWRERIDDKVRAEGIASQDFQSLFVDCGTVIIATRCFKELDFREILDKYRVPYEVKVKQEQVPPQVGGWRKFGRQMAASRRSKNNRRAYWPLGGKNAGKKGQLKKGGRGWLHFRV